MLDRRTVFIGGFLFSIAMLCVVGLVYLAIRLGTILTYLILAWILSSGLSPVVKWLEGRRVGRFSVTRPPAVLIVVLGLLICVIGLAVLVGAPTSQQVRSFLGDSNEYFYQVKINWEKIQAGASWLPDLSGAVDRLLAYLKARSRNEPEMAQLGLGVLRGLTGAFTVLVITAFMLLQPPLFAQLADWIAPEERRPRVRAAFASVARRFQRWLRAQVILSITIGLVTFLGLLVLRIPYPHLLAVVAAVGELIPVVGPLLAAIPAVIVAFSQSPEQVIGVAALALAIQFFENYWLVPRVMHQVVGVPPLATIVGLLNRIRALRDPGCDAGGSCHRRPGHLDPRGGWGACRGHTVVGQ